MKCTHSFHKEAASIKLLLTLGTLKVLAEKKQNGLSQLIAEGHLGIRTNIQCLHPYSINNTGLTFW